jgi:methionyl-tRNA formyltransferase
MLCGGPNQMYGNSVKTVFFGTPRIAVPSLRALTEVSTVVGVVCQPDRPAGRGLALGVPEVKAAALKLGLPVHQPVKVRTGDLDAWLKARDVDAALVLAYGRILPPQVLAAPRLGCLNLHASLLPRYRGAAPINWALIRGETETGVSLMQMDEGLDTGPVYCNRRLPIGKEDDAGTLTDALAELARTMTLEDLPRVLNGELEARAQDESEATHAPPIARAQTILDFTLSSESLCGWVRGLSPRPGATTLIGDRRLKILKCRSDPAALGSSPADAPLPDALPGTVVVADRRGIAVATGAGLLWIERAQAEGRKVQDARDLVNGRALAAGDRLGGP